MSADNELNCPNCGVLNWIKLISHGETVMRNKCQACGYPLNAAIMQKADVSTDCKTGHFKIGNAEVFGWTKENWQKAGLIK